MITEGDDYPLHQTSRTFRDPGTDRNFYDRFFFNGYTRDGQVFFAMALGLYPGRDIMDAAFSVSVDGAQHNLRASRILGTNRLDTRVGPIRVAVVEPLRTLRVEVDDTGPDSAGSDLRASLTFTARGPAFEEPHYLWKPGHRTLFDITRMTQNGSWTGTIGVGDLELALDPAQTWGTRDRSWGIRPLGEPDPPGAPETQLGYYWLWAPLNFDDTCLLFDVNEWPDGVRWHESAMWAPADRIDAPVTRGGAAYHLEFKPGTRHASSATIEFLEADGTPFSLVRLSPITTFFMQGIGYNNHPRWGHGRFVGPDSRTYDTIDLVDADEAAPIHLHVQTLCRASRDGGADGVGVLEQLIVGPHAPSGLKDVLDMHD